MNLQHARMLILLIVMGFNIALCLPGCVPCYPSCTPSSQKRHSSRTNASVPNHFIHIHAEQTHTGWLVGNVHIPANNGPTFFGEVILNDFIISHYSSHMFVEFSFERKATNNTQCNSCNVCTVHMHTACAVVDHAVNSVTVTCSVKSMSEV